jgi:murein DD-endopeptidase MepM/ murein hydrolase activator NlpD
MKSIVWDNQDFPVTQEFGVPGFRPDWYQYSADLGWPAGYHVGLDIGMPRGTTIRAAQGGQVIQAGMSPYFRPEPVWVQEDDGDIAIYGHLWKSKVKEGDSVAPGQVLGISGEQTYPGTKVPDGSGPHLHFELRRPKGGSYVAVDPKPELLGAEMNIIQTSLKLGPVEISDNVMSLAAYIILIGIALGSVIYVLSE